MEFAWRYKKTTTGYLIENFVKKVIMFLNFDEFSSDMMPIRFGLCRAVSEPHAIKVIN